MAEGPPVDSRLGPTSGKGLPLCAPHRSVATPVLWNARWIPPVLPGLQRLPSLLSQWGKGVLWPHRPSPSALPPPPLQTRPSRVSPPAVPILSVRRDKPADHPQMSPTRLLQGVHPSMRQAPTPLRWGRCLLLDFCRHRSNQGSSLGLGRLEGCRFVPGRSALHRRSATTRAGRLDAAGHETVNRLPSDIPLPQGSVRRSPQIHRPGAVRWQPPRTSGSLLSGNW